MSLKDKALGGVKWTALSSVVTVSTQLIQLIVLSRYLDPLDFGLMAMAVVVIGFSQMFIDMGVSNSIIHKQNITKKELDSLYLVNILSGVFIFFVLFVASPYIAEFYKEPKLSLMIRWISISFLIQPFGQQFLVLFKKELRFNEIAKRDVISKVISLILAIALAMNGFGVYAFVFSNLCLVILSTFLLVYFGLQYHRPGLYFNYSSIRDSLKFGLFQMGENFINYFNTQFDNILIGRLLGVETLGIYDLAKNIAVKPAQIINPIITSIGFPIMAKLQGDIPKLKTTYLKTINYLSSINFPIYIFIAIFAEQLILLIFGPKWMEAIPILRILALFGMIRSTLNPVGGLILARGRADLGFYWNLTLFFLIPISIYAGSFYGLKGIALTLLILQIGVIVPSWYFLVNKMCEAGLGEYLKNIIKPLIVAISMGVLSIGIIYNIQNLVLYIIAGSLPFIFGFFILNKLINPEIYSELINEIKKVLSIKR